ncbi:MAG: helix-turn-helix domain-containing protein [Oligoflexales bacterium]
MVKSRKIADQSSRKQFSTSEMEMLEVSEKYRLMTSTEASEFLQVKLSTLYTWVHWKKIPYRKYGRLLRFCKYELIVWSKSSND